MLTLAQITKLYGGGINIKFYKRRSSLKGEFNPGLLEIYIYTVNIESDFDRDITILHEFIHARDDIESARRSNVKTDDAVEKEALKTYSKRPHILEYIKQLYYLK